MPPFEGFLILTGRTMLGSALVLSRGLRRAVSATAADFTPISQRGLIQSKLGVIKGPDAAEADRYIVAVS